MSGHVRILRGMILLNEKNYEMFHHVIYPKGVEES
jgi:hypothetical protein